MELWRQIVETDPTVIGLAEGSRVFEVTVRPPQLAGLATGGSTIKRLVRADTPEQAREIGRCDDIAVSEHNDRHTFVVDVTDTYKS